LNINLLHHEIDALIYSVIHPFYRAIRCRFSHPRIPLACDVFGVLKTHFQLSVEKRYYYYIIYQDIIRDHTMKEEAMQTVGTKVNEKLNK
jgi:hypothetical protein